MKCLFSILFVIMSFGSAQALMPDPFQLTNTGMYVPFGCEVWNDGCNDCVKIATGYECPPRNCANDFAGYCREWERDREPKASPGWPGEPVVLPPAPPVVPPPAYAPPDTCQRWFNGCNTCSGTGPMAICTQRACEVYNEPRCLDEKVTQPPTALAPANRFDNIPVDCVKWFDGCNYCQTRDREVIGCDTEHCASYWEPKCVEFDDRFILPQPFRPELTVPVGCTQWFDGCNTCAVENGQIQMCSERACDPNQMEPPRCTQFQTDTSDSNEPFLLPPPVSNEDRVPVYSCDFVLEVAAQTCTARYNCDRFGGIREMGSRLFDSCVRGEGVDQEFAQRFFSDITPGAFNCCVGSGLSFMYEQDPQGYLDRLDDPMWQNLAAPTGGGNLSEPFPGEAETDPTIVPPYQPPAGCERWFDGCNTCSLMQGDIAACTERMCTPGDQEPPRCLSSADSEVEVISEGLMDEPTADTALVEPEVKLSFWGWIKYHLFGVGK